MPVKGKKTNLTSKNTQFVFINSDVTINAQKTIIDELTRVNKELTEQKAGNTEQASVNSAKISELEQQMYGILIFRNYFN